MTNSRRRAAKRPDRVETVPHSATERETLLKDWLIRVTAAQFGHQIKADRNRRYGIALGIPTVIISTIVGTAAFAAINDQSGDTMKFIVGIVSVLAAVLASIQTYLGYAQLAERHRVAGVRYAALRREIQHALANLADADVKNIRREMDKIGAVGPQIGERLWQRCLARAQREVQAGLVRVDADA